MEEEWKVCIEGEDYEISNLGNCRRKLKGGGYNYVGGSILKTGGYRYIQLTRCCKRFNFPIHHLVAKCFIGERPVGLVIDHIDRNPVNNNVSNLRYITQLENTHNTRTYRDDIKCEDKKKRLKLMRENKRK